MDFYLLIKHCPEGRRNGVLFNYLGFGLMDLTWNQLHQH